MYLGPNEVTTAYLGDNEWEKDTPILPGIYLWKNGAFIIEAANTGVALNFIITNAVDNDQWEVRYYEQATSGKIELSQTNYVINNLSIKLVNMTRDTTGLIDITVDGDRCVYHRINNVNLEIDGFSLTGPNITTTASATVDFLISRQDGGTTSPTDQWFANADCILRNCRVDGGTTTRTLVRLTNSESVQEVTAHLRCFNCDFVGGSGDRQIFAVVSNILEVEGCTFVPTQNNTGGQPIQIDRAQEVMITDCIFDASGFQWKHAIIMGNTSVMIESMTVDNCLMRGGFVNRNIWVLPAANGLTQPADPNIAGGVRTIINTATVTVKDSTFEDCGSNGYITIENVRSYISTGNTMDAPAASALYHNYFIARDGLDKFTEHTYNTYNVAFGSGNNQSAVRATGFTDMVLLSDFNTFNRSQDALFRLLFLEGQNLNTLAEAQAAGYELNSTDTIVP